MNFENPLYNWSKMYTSEILQENSTNHEYAFFIVKVWETFGQIGTP